MKVGEPEGSQESQHLRADSVQWLEEVRVNRSWSWWQEVAGNQRPELSREESCGICERMGN